jgi:riboflavin kinase / FMN adenylyltransferase
MEFVRGLHNLRPDRRGCAVTIGNFDGVHLGHRAVIAELVERARALGVPAVAMLFEPQPLEHFRGDAAPARLMRLREKLETLSHLPLDRVVCLHFDAHLAAMEPETFTERVLRDGLGTRHIVVGADFHYGRARRGDIDMLARAGRAYGFEVATAPTFDLDGSRVSSTRVRAALAQGDMKMAERLLGRPYQMCGRVMHGEQIGRRLSVPTANIALHRHRAPIAGIFVAEMQLGAERFASVASVGTRPTIGGSQPLLEVHAFDFDREIYGQLVMVDFLHRLRDEHRFDTLDDMRRQIVKDIEAARHYFSRRPRAAASAT